MRLLNKEVELTFERRVSLIAYMKCILYHLT